MRARQATDGRSSNLSAVPTEQQHLLLLQAASGAIGGMSAAIATNPLEVLRIRIQVRRRVGDKPRDDDACRCIEQPTGKR